MWVFLLLTGATLSSAFSPFSLIPAVWAKPKIELTQAESRKFARSLDRNFQKLPRKFTSAYIDSENLVFPSGTKWRLSNLRYMRSQKPDQLIQTLVRMGIEVKIICSHGPQYLRTITRHQCVQHPRLEKLLSPKKRAFFLSRYHSENRSSIPQILTSSDTGRLALLLAYAGYLQEYGNKKFIRDYSFKSVRTALKNELTQKKEKNTNDQLILEQLRLTELMQDEIELYEAFLRFRKRFKLSYPETKHLHDQLLSALKKCSDQSRCQKKTTQLDTYAIALLDEQITERIRNAPIHPVTTAFVDRQLEKFKGINEKDFQTLFRELRSNFLVEKRLEQKQKRVSALQSIVDRVSSSDEKKAAHYDEIFSWKAVESIIDYGILLGLHQSLEKYPELRKFAENVKKELHQQLRYVRNSPAYGKTLTPFEPKT